MLQGKKPFAAFCDEIESSYNEEIIPEKSFAPYVAQGAFSRREVIVEAPPHVLRRVLFALPGEEWRMDAYLLLWEVAKKSGWNDSLERMEGRLLGYEDCQCDFHIKYRTERMQKFLKEQEATRQGD